MDTTVRPTSRPAVDGCGPAEPQPVVELLFHSDLSRIGDRIRPELLAGSAEGPEVVVGRDFPDLAEPTGRRALPLDDPCVSRKQLAVRWLPDRGVFSCRRHRSGGREVSFLRPDLSPAADGELLPPGSIVVLEDRALLGLSVGRWAEAGADRLGMVGESAAAWALRDGILRCAHFDSTVLVQGESGSGKECAARALHSAGPRRARAFEATNCATLDGELVESTLFGHTAGAYTGASKARSGLFRTADGGTLLLDEVAELPLGAQAKLLRVLEENEVRPVGSDRPISVDVRLVCATRTDLRQAAAAGRFRDDLYYRIAALAITLPPLRDRSMDVPGLFRHFFARETKGQPELKRWWRRADEHHPLVPMSYLLGLLRYDWARNNVRELRNYVAQTAAANLVAPDFVAPPLPGASPASPEVPAGRGRAIEDLDRAGLLRLLRSVRFNAREAARRANVSPTTLYRHLDRCGIRDAGDVSSEELQEAVDRVGGEDLARLAEVLEVRSLKGLSAQMGRLGIGR